MFEASKRFEKSVTLEQSLQSGSLNFLLEDVSKDEADKLEAAVAQTKEGLGALVSAIDGAASTKMGNVKDYFTKAAEELPGQGELASLAIAGDVKGIKKATTKATGVMTQVQAARDSFTNAVQLLASNLSALEYTKTGDKSKTIKEIGNMAEEERKQFPDEKTLRKGIERSFTPSKETKGLFGSIMGFFKGKMGFTLDKKVFVEDVLELSLDELMNLQGPLQQADAKGDEGAKAAAEATAAVGDTVSGEGGEKKKGEEAAPDEAKGDEGKEGEAKEEKAPAGKSWKDVAQAVAAATQDSASAKEILASLGKTDGFKNAVGDKIIFEESYYRRPIHSFSLTSLLNEVIGFEDLIKLVVPDGDVKDKGQVFVDIATALNKEIGEEIITNISSGEKKEDKPAGDDDGLGPEAQKADAEAEKVAAAVGKGPLSKDELAMILKKYPDIVGTGKVGNKARRVFRKAINQAAGSTIFEEGFSRRDAQLLVEMLVDDSHSQSGFIDTTVDLNPGWSNDELAMDKMLRMAGLRGRG